MTTVTAHLKVTSKLRGCTTLVIDGKCVECRGCGEKVWLMLSETSSRNTVYYTMSATTAAQTFYPHTIDETDDRFWPLYKMLHYDRDMEAAQ
jgi:hypothetical protein